ncbi:DUF2922 domain-containing protein [Lactobacillus helveticus]|uniref:DUF2922 domain-containing protein n=1 Tax=Lactobacillus helveticus TaxID=1587 RepID=UPI001F11D248|nr:DUF2922 domain-containing protein [Lactobacillus helveticus]
MLNNLREENINEQGFKINFYNSKGKTSVITLHNPKNVDADTAKAAMQKVIDANIFDNADINPYATIVGAKYYETQSTPIFEAE